MKKSVQNRKSVAGQRRKEKRESVNGNGNGKVRLAPIAKAVQQNFVGGSRSGRASWRFPGRELIGDVSGTTGFGTTRYIINPGLSQTFPWLSGEADKWEQYRFHRLRFVYVPRCASTTVGSVLLSPDYNVRDLAPTTELEAADTFGAVENSAWTEIACNLDVSAMFPIGPRKMIRQANVAGDMNLYDCGSFYVSTTGEADTSLIGKLWVEYDVEFYVPQNSPADQAGQSMIQQFLRALAQTFVTATPALLDWDTPVLNPLFISDVSGTITPRAGCYLVMFSGSFNDATPETFGVTVNLRKNTVTQLTAQAEAATAGGPVCLASNIIMAFNGSDTMDVQVTCVGAAGVLTLLAASANLTFIPA